MCVFAHPDDESLGCGFTLARYAAEGIDISLLCATRGERGWQDKPEVFPGMAQFGRIREMELMDAAHLLGIGEVHFLDYIDGDLDKVDRAEAVEKIVGHIRRIRPQVVLTFDPTGAYGHPDHIAISQYALGAVVAAADIGYADQAGQVPHRVSKVYYMIDSEKLVDMIRELAGKIEMEVDGELREHTGWPDWAATTLIDGSAYWETCLEAIACHATQVDGLLDKLRRIPETHDPRVWSVQSYYCVYSLVNGGSRVETDFFQGLRG